MTINSIYKILMYFKFTNYKSVSLINFFGFLSFSAIEFFFFILLIKNFTEYFTEGNVIQNLQLSVICCGLTAALLIRSSFSIQRSRFIIVFFFLFLFFEETKWISSFYNPHASFSFHKVLNTNLVDYIFKVISIIILLFPKEILKASKIITHFPQKNEFYLDKRIFALKTLIIWMLILLYFFLSDKENLFFWIWISEEYYELMTYILFLWYTINFLNQKDYFDYKIIHKNMLPRLLSCTLILYLFFILFSLNRFKNAVIDVKIKHQYLLNKLIFISAMVDDYKMKYNTYPKNLQSIDSLIIKYLTEKPSFFYTYLSGTKSTNKMELFTNTIGKPIFFLRNQKNHYFYIYGTYNVFPEGPFSESEINSMINNKPPTAGLLYVIRNGNVVSGKNFNGIKISLRNMYEFMKPINNSNKP